MGWIDSHAHLVSDSMYNNIEENIKNAKEADIERILIICGNLEQVKRGILWAEKESMLDLAIGVHPSDVHEVDEKEYLEMITYLDHPSVVAVGEIGLDYYWDTTYSDIQKEYFIKQLQLANDKELPIIVHVRSSIEDTLVHLEKYDKHHVGVIHCFSETPDIGVKLQDWGYYLGYGGILTFKNGENVRENFKVTSKDRVLSETDSPYLAPIPKRGKPNQSAYVAYVGDYIANLWNMDKDETQNILRKNYERLFK